jgi:hypothetical protein
VDRINALIVVFDRDLVGAEAWPLIHAIEQFKGVVAVSPHWAMEHDRPENIVDFRSS